MVRLRIVRVVVLSTPTSERPFVLGFRLLLFVPEMTVPFRSWPCSVTLLFAFR